MAFLPIYQLLLKLFDINFEFWNSLVACNSWFYHLYQLHNGRCYKSKAPHFEMYINKCVVTLFLFIKQTCRYCRLVVSRWTLPSRKRKHIWDLRKFFPRSCLLVPIPPRMKSCNIGLLLTITLRFICGQKKIYSTIRNSQNSMNTIAASFRNLPMFHLVSL